MDDGGAARHRRPHEEVVAVRHRRAVEVGVAHRRAAARPSRRPARVLAERLRERALVVAVVAGGARRQQRRRAAHHRERALARPHQEEARVRVLRLGGARGAVAFVEHAVVDHVHHVDAVGEQPPQLRRRVGAEGDVDVGEQRRVPRLDHVPEDGELAARQLAVRRLAPAARLLRAEAERLHDAARAREPAQLVAPALRRRDDHRAPVEPEARERAQVVCREPPKPAVRKYDVHEAVGVRVARRAQRVGERAVGGERRVERRRGRRRRLPRLADEAREHRGNSERRNTHTSCGCQSGTSRGDGLWPVDASREIPAVFCRHVAEPHTHA